MTDMNKITQATDDILSAYLDNSLSDIERKRVEDSLKGNAAWRVRLEELRLVHSLLQDSVIEQPSKNFTVQVMRRLDQYPAPSGFSTRNGFIVLVGVLLVVGMATILVASGSFDNVTANIDLNKVALWKKVIKSPLPTFTFDGKLLVKVIIVLNLALGWIVLDRTILKPFFQKRMQEFH